MKDIKKLLDERENTHGDWEETALLHGQLIDLVLRKGMFHTTNSALTQILLKISRISKGNDLELDHWKDIIGYATLEHDRLKKRQEKEELNKP